MIYRIHKPNSGYILFTESDDSLENLSKRYPGANITPSTYAEFHAYRTLSNQSYQELTDNPRKGQKGTSGKRPRKPVFSTTENKKPVK